MVQELLMVVARLLSSMLRVPRVARNCALVYALQRRYPEAFRIIEDSGGSANNEDGNDAGLRTSLRHVRAVIGWFQEQCPTEAHDGEIQMSHLQAAAPKLPAAIDAL